MKLSRVLLSAVAVLTLSAPAWAESAPGEEPHHKGGMFEKMDENTDGSVSKDEFINGSLKRFEKMDADANGALSKEEVKSMHEKMRVRWKERKAQHEDGKAAAPDAAETKPAE